MIIVLLGPQGSGKGTQARLLSKKLALPHVCMGDLLREEIEHGTPLGKRVQSFVQNGHLVPDNIALQLLRKRISESDCSQGFVLDGFPRTLAQAKHLDEFLKEFGKKVGLVLNISIPREESVKRLADRRTCSRCGEIYGVNHHEFRNDSCPLCGGALVQREDETPCVIQTRLDAYYKHTPPLLKHYSKKRLLKTIDGEGSIQQVFERVWKAVDGAR